jgi:Asp/Glu/hydantoin racemase
MKKRLALIHTVDWYKKSVVEPFAEPWLLDNPDVELMNIADDRLLADSLAAGGATRDVLRRLQLYVMAAEGAGADVCMITCTSVGEASRIARGHASIPVFNIDEPMAEQAVEIGGHMGVIATVPTSAPATRALIQVAADRRRRAVAFETVIREDAFAALMAGDRERHDAIVHAEMDRLAGHVNAIVLGQISLAQIRHRPAGVPVLQVGHSGFAEARRLLDTIRAPKRVQPIQPAQPIQPIQPAAA